MKDSRPPDSCICVGFRCRNAKSVTDRGVLVRASSTRRCRALGVRLAGTAALCPIVGIPNRSLNCELLSVAGLPHCKNSGRWRYPAFVFEISQPTKQAARYDRLIYWEKRMRCHFACFVIALTADGSAAGQQNYVSIYTPISGKTCVKHIDDQSTRAFTLDCPGALGFRLKILRDDDRSSVSIVTPNQLVLPLNYWNVVTRGFSNLGTKAEWRIGQLDGKAAPVALIVRVNSLDQSDPGHPERVTLLAVAKVSTNAACVTRAVDALSPQANKQARQFADDGHLACLPVTSDTESPTKG